MRITDETVSAAQAGDTAALRTIYRELAPLVVGYLTAKGVADPEAVTSDVFVAVLQRLDTITGGAAGLRTFVMSVAHARLVDETRRRQRQPGSTTYLPETDPRLTDSAEQAALSEMDRLRLVAMLRRLPESQREVLLLRVIADLPIDDVAQIVGRSAGAVKQLQRRGLLSLRQMLEEQA
ncbi:MAG: sigma-70 family RNA polymerase sigma factor [Actinomycetota bacterium]|nr:sigma-70 family RNA polymerase sigma factor [Actinomycetota bacterium]